jgi:hypothetical protein
MLHDSTNGLFSVASSVESHIIWSVRKCMWDDRNTENLGEGVHDWDGDGLQDTQQWMNACCSSSILYHCIMKTGLVDCDAM